MAPVRPARPLQEGTTMLGPQQQQQPVSSTNGIGNALSWILFAARSLAVTVEVFLHRSDSFGERYFGFQAAAGFLLILLYPLFWQEHDVSGVLLFLGAYLLMLLWARVRTALRVRRGGGQPHTRYSGRPGLLRISRRLSERFAKCCLEPLIVFLSGPPVMAWSEPLGGYLMLAGLGLFISTNAAAGYEGRRAADMHDAFIEQRSLAEEFRRMRGDR